METRHHVCPMTSHLYPVYLTTGHMGLSSVEPNTELLRRSEKSVGDHTWYFCIGIHILRHMQTRSFYCVGSRIFQFHYSSRYVTQWFVISVFFILWFDCTLKVSLLPNHYRLHSLICPLSFFLSTLGMHCHCYLLTVSIVSIYVLRLIFELKGRNGVAIFLSEQTFKSSNSWYQQDCILHICLYQLIPFVV